MTDPWNALGVFGQWSHPGFDFLALKIEGKSPKIKTKISSLVSEESKRLYNYNDEIITHMYFLLHAHISLT